MIKFCPECGKEILGSSKKCANCGAVLQNETGNKKKKGLPVWAIILIVVGSILFLFAGCCAIIAGVDNADNPSNSTTGSTANNNGTTKTYVTTTTTAASDSTSLTAKIVGLMSEKLAFDSGSYQRGDIPAGEYAYVKFAGAGSYYEEEDPAGNILDNENFDSFGYVKVHGKGDVETRGVLINVKSFESLGVTGAKDIYEKLNNTKDYYDAGYYKVGTDIPAGTYTVESYGSGYYAVLSGPVGSSDIVKNDNFNGKKTVKVKNGQYLELSRASLIMN